MLQQLLSKLSKGVEYILFIEDDTKVNLQSLSKLIKRLEPKERQFLGRGMFGSDRVCTSVFVFALD